jgi:hypothetical protein
MKKPTSKDVQVQKQKRKEKREGKKQTGKNRWVKEGRKELTVATGKNNGASASSKPSSAGLQSVEWACTNQGWTVRKREDKHRNEKKGTKTYGLENQHKQVQALRTWRCWTSVYLPTVMFINGSKPSGATIPTVMLFRICILNIVNLHVLVVPQSDECWHNRGYCRSEVSTIAKHLHGVWAFSAICELATLRARAASD